jgi:single-strand DNA-binding protein
MSGINKALIIGRLGQDPEVKFLPNGTAVANFSVATSEEWKDKDTGEKKEDTQWHKIVAWRRLGEICGEYLKKGSQCFIEGKITTRSWEDKEGTKRYTTEIVANNVQFLGGRAESQGHGEPSEGYTTTAPDKVTVTPTDDDIPF